MCNNFGSSKPWMTGNSAPPNLIGIPRGNSIRSLSAWPFMRSKNCRSLFFQEDTSEKFLILLLSYLPVFWLQISSVFAIISADCHGLSCVHVRASSYTALFRVSLSGVGLRCVGLAQKISARCNTASYVFSFFFIWIFILLLALSHIYVFLFPQRVPSDLEVGYEKSILTRMTRTETFPITIYFKEPLLFITFSRERVFICYLFPLEHETRSW